MRRGSWRRRKRESRLWSRQPPLSLLEKRRKENWEKERDEWGRRERRRSEWN